MVVLAASLCTASGKVLISRQFVNVPKTRIEGLLSAFPKLTDVGSQHTTIETENIRYVYQPMDHLFLILITNRQSNILQDLDTLRLLGRAVTEICHSTDEVRVLENSFELLSAFDEVIQFGYRDSVTLSQIKTIIEMESHEERIQDIIAKNKEKEAKDRMKEKVREFEEARKRAARSGGPSGSGGIGSGYKSGFASIPSQEPNYPRSSEPAYEKPKPKVPTNALGSGSGMKLGSKKKTTDFMDSLMEETGIVETTSPTLDQKVEELPEEEQEGVHLQFRENLSCQVSRDGGVEGLDLKGELTLKVNNGDQSKIKVPLSFDSGFGYQFKTHPNIDKQKFNEESVLQLKDLSRSFPVGTGLGVLKWRVNSKNEKLVPFSVNCWPNVVDDHCEVNLEIELENKALELNNIIIEIPIPHNTEPVINEVDGNHEVDHDHSVLVWEIPSLNSEKPTANLDFKAQTDDSDTFFPIQVGLECSQPYSGINITEVLDAQSQESYQYSTHSALTLEEFSII